MIKPTVWRLTIILALLAVAGYFFLKEPPATVKSPPPIDRPPKSSDPVPAGAGSPPAPATELRTGKMELSSPPAGFKSAPATAAPFSYTLKKENNERPILPGVTFSPGQGVSIKTTNADETVQIKRDAGQTTDYQVMWQKKY